MRSVPDYLIGYAAERFFDRLNPLEREGSDDQPEAYRVYSSYRYQHGKARHQRTCTCSAYPFPHRLNGGKCSGSEL